jgi:NAD(P)-dependent dehydrogenase (short-subunit alcohol dehydrogenase family)
MTSRCPGISEDIAEGVLFLNSDKASFITGEVHQINGGLGIF